MATPELALIPTGYKAGKVYSVLPETGVGDFTFTRASEAVRTNSAGLLEVEATGVPRLEYPLIDGVVNGCPSLLLEPQATNLITYPISFGNSYWTKSGASIEGDPSTAGSELITNGDFASGTTGWTPYSSATLNNAGSALNIVGVGTANGRATSPITTVIGGLYYITTDVVSIGSTSTTIGITNSANGDSAYFNSSAITTPTSVDFYFTATSTTTYVVFKRAGSVDGDTNIYDNVSVKEVQGYSSPSVDFPTSGFKLVEGTNTGTHRLYKGSFATVSSKTFTLSAYVKANGRDWFNFSVYKPNDGTSVGGDAWFDVSNGVLGTVTFGTSKIESFTNGWYKCSYTFSCDAACTGLTVYNLLSEANGDSTYTGDGTSGVYLFMSQVEQGSFATSPTLTSLSAEGTTTTRVAETCTGAGDASTFNDSEGVLFVEISALDLLSGVSRTIMISSSDGLNYVNIYFQSTGQLTVYNNVNGVNTVLFEQVLNDITSFNKCSLKWGSQGYELWANGIKLESSASTSLPTGLSELMFNWYGNIRYFYGKTKQIQYFQTVLTDLELETLTSWTSFTAMANAQQYNII